MRRRTQWTSLAATAVLVTAAGAAYLGTLTVESASVVLRQSPSSIAPSAGKFERGTQFSVIEDRGAFVRVHVGATSEGWLRVADLKPRTFAGPAVKDTVLTGSASAGGATESASAKGLGDGMNDIAAAYAQSRGVSPDALQKLMDQRRTLVESGQVQQFARDGHVGKP